MLIRYLLLAARVWDAGYPKDPNPDNWRTINGARVHVDGDGNADGGAGGKFNGNKFGTDWRVGQRSALMQAANIFNEKGGTKMKGSEKQVKWANDLVENVLSTAKEGQKWAQSITPRNEKEAANKEKMLNVLDDVIKNIPNLDSAREIIDAFKNFKPESNTPFDVRKKNVASLVYYISHSEIKNKITNNL